MPRARRCARSSRRSTEERSTTADPPSPARMRGVHGIPRRAARSAPPGGAAASRASAARFARSGARAVRRRRRGDHGQRRRGRAAASQPIAVAVTGAAATAPSPPSRSPPGPAARPHKVAGRARPRAVDGPAGGPRVRARPAGRSRAAPTAMRAPIAPPRRTSFGPRRAGHRAACAAQSGAPARTAPPARRKQPKPKPTVTPKPAPMAQPPPIPQATRRGRRARGSACARTLPCSDHSHASSAGPRPRQRAPQVQIGVSAASGRRSLRPRPHQGGGAGSSWDPATRSISASAAARGIAARYGRSDVIASSVSATRMIRDSSGMASPCRRSGYPVPSQRSWWLLTIAASARRPACCNIVAPTEAWASTSWRSCASSGARLAEHLAWHVALADVVQERSPAERDQALAGDPEPAPRVRRRAARRRPRA